MASSQLLFEDTTIITDRMKDFCFYFIRRLEARFNFYLLILEEDSNGADKTSTAMTVLANGASAIPTIGKPISAAITQGEKYFANKSDKADAYRLCELVYHHAKNPEASRKIYLSTAYELFVCYEKQFIQVTCKGGVTRAIEKLAYDAAERLISAILGADYNITSILDQKTMIEAIVENSGGLLHDLGLMKIGRTVKMSTKSKSKHKTWNSSDIYTKVGVYLPDKNLFYINTQSKVDLYGFRHRFTFETEEYLRKNYDVCDYHEHNLDLTPYTFSPYEFQKHYDEINQYCVERLNPIKADLQDKHEELVKVIETVEDRAQVDRDVKHEEAMTSRIELHKDLKADHGEQKQMEVAILQKLDDVSKKQEEYAKKVCEIQDEKVVINKKSVDEFFKKIDPTRNHEFVKLKKKIRKIKL
ncbi:uncharacterized protein [Atheta coriaria]|uniref:uncharacterized protein n=1 Tax=Dalotia coriaria TaxID=877792 RepID=UPI0031F33B8A